MEEMSGDNDVVCVLWICVVVGTESYVCDQLPKLPEEPPPIGDCASRCSWRMCMAIWIFDSGLLDDVVIQ